MPACLLKVLIIVATTQGAIVLQLQSDVDGDAIVLGHDFPFIVDVFEDIYIAADQVSLSRG